MNIRGLDQTSAGSTFDIVVTGFNSGPDVAHGAVLTVTFSPASSVASVLFCDSLPCAGSSGTYTISLGDLIPGHFAGTRIEALVSGTASGPITVTASVTAYDASGAPIADPDPTNNSQTFSIQVLPPPADLFIGFGPAASGYDDNAIVVAGASTSLTVNIGNAGPSTASDATLSITLPWPIQSCVATGGGVCSPTSFGAQVVFPFLAVSAPAAPTQSVTIAVLVPAAADPGSQVSGHFYISAANLDENTTNNGAVCAFRVQAPLTDAISISTTRLDFGAVPFGFNSPSQMVTVTNVSAAPITLESPFLTSEFYVISDTCFSGYLGPTDLRTVTLAPGASCITDVATTPHTLGTYTGEMVYTELDQPGQLSATLDAAAVSLFTNAAELPLIPVGTTQTSTIYVYNVGPVAVHLSSIALTGGSFSETNDCRPSLPTSPPGTVTEGCSITVTYAPTAAGRATGFLTIVADDPAQTVVTQLGGRAASLTMTSPGSLFSTLSGSLVFDEHVLDIPIVRRITLTNVSAVKSIASIATSGDEDFSQSNDCPTALKAGASCHIDAVFTPGTLGAREATISVLDRATGLPQTVSLTGEGIGIGDRRQLYLHYDYMVLPDQGTACTPDQTALDTSTSKDCDEGQYCLDNVCRGHSHRPPADAIDAIVEAFARRGVDLKVDPVSTAIPESRYLEMDSPAVGCQTGDGRLLYANDSVYFYDLKSKYYKPSSPQKQEHYAVLGHYGYTPDFGCLFFTGESPAVPGYDFMVTLGEPFDAGFFRSDPALLVHATAGTLMHEFGHNLGLDHPSPNYSPNQLSVMNYSYQFGIPEADRPGSAVADPARTLIDYSSQVLPLAGNTPGTLTAADLSEPAGLGSGDAKIIYFVDGQDRSEVAPADGPVDWDGDGSADNPHAQDPWLFSLAFDPPAPSAIGYDEWSYLFTGDAHPGQPGSYPNHRVREREQSIDDAMARHVLAVPRTAQVMIQPGCTLAQTPIAPGQPGLLRIALLGSTDFDVRQVDVSSLAVHGARPVSVTTEDVNGNGFPDLLLTFATSEVKLNQHATKLRVTGWLASSRLFAGEGNIVVMPNTFNQPAGCQQ